MTARSNEPSQPRRRLFFDLQGIDWNDDASIDAWAQKVWEYSTTEWKSPMTASPATVLTDRYTQAIAYATAIHATQLRKGTTVPYVTHLIGVSSLVLEAGGTEDEAIAGLLHDAIEDCGGLPRATDIRARFGDRVTDIVLACSDSTDEEWKRTVDYWERKQAYLDHLESSADERAVLVSIADKVHNARAIVTDLQRDGVGVLGKFTGSAGDLLTYYVECLRIAELRNVPEALLWPLFTAVTELDAFVMGACE